MVTVRFSNGLSVQYNTAGFISEGATYHRLLTKRDGDFVARVPIDCIVEMVKPCKIYNAASDELDAVWKENRRLNRQIARLQKKRISK